MSDLERCDREIAEILARPDIVAGIAPAYLVTLGIEDWEAEKRLIQRVLDMSVNGHIVVDGPMVLRASDKSTDSTTSEEMRRK